MEEKKKETQVNMFLPTETWEKVGIMSALQSTTKRAVVELAIEEYYKKKGVKK